MSEILDTPLRGKIKMHGRFFPNYGVVELDEPYDNLKYAIINDETKGRIALLNLSSNGCLPADQKVLINKIRRGGGAFIALDVVAVAMTPFEQFSADTKQITDSFKTSRVTRFLCFIEYLGRRYWSNRPLQFLWVENEGEPVGEPIEIVHLMLDDMMEHEAAGVVTGKVFLEGLQINAIQVIGFECLDRMNAKTTIQPRWV